MWQRVQTLYLAVATGLVAALFWCDEARIILPDGGVQYLKYTRGALYLIWLILLTLVQVLALGGYRWRMKQMRVTVVAAILCLGFQGFLVYDYIVNHNEVIFNATALFPLAAAVLDFFAIRNILIDEALVQSASRLRLPRKKK